MVLYLPKYEPRQLQLRLWVLDGVLLDLNYVAYMIILHLNPSSPPKTKNEPSKEVSHQKFVQNLPRTQGLIFWEQPNCHAKSVKQNAKENISMHGFSVWEVSSFGGKVQLCGLWTIKIKMNFQHHKCLIQYSRDGKYLWLQPVIGLLLGIGWSFQFTEMGMMSLLLSFIKWHIRWGKAFTLTTMMTMAQFPCVIIVVVSDIIIMDHADLVVSFF